MTNAAQAPATQRDPGFYDYLPYNDRPIIKWPNGARVAFWVAPNVEFYELNPPVSYTHLTLPTKRIV